MPSAVTSCKVQRRQDIQKTMLTAEHIGDEWCQAKDYEYNGKELTEYEATQTQRYIERQIRKYKREIAGLEAAGIDSTESRAWLKKWQQRQRDFIDQTGL